MVSQRSVPIERASQSRVFFIESGAGLANPPEYLGLGRAGAVAWPQGATNPIRAPSESAYGEFDIVDTYNDQQGLPSMPLEVRKQRQLSRMLQLVRKRCDLDIQVHAGACRNPSDFDDGWELIMVLERAKPTDYTTSELGALDGDQEGPVMETVPFTGMNYYEIKPIIPGELAAAELVQEAIDVAICDSRQCGECGLPSDGCQRIFALTLSAGGSPGLAAEVVYSENGGGSWGDTNVTTLAANEDPNALGCVGPNLIVISEDSESLHYAPIADILNGAETWSKVTTGFVSTKGPLAIFSISSTKTWIVAEGGYIYFTSDPTSGVEVQSSGAATTEDLRAIHGIDERNLIVVGGNNAVLVTDNGGETWSSVTGPAPAIVLNAVWMRSTTEWVIGAADGKLYYTRNSGATWTEKAFPGSGSGSVTDIKFSSRSVGYMAHTTTTPRGRILRTINGGYSWYVLPESSGVMPNNDRINKLAACEEDMNVVYGAGLADNAVDGFLVKAA